MGLKCKLFGHDWRVIRDEGRYTYTNSSNWCRKCGITKEDLKKKHDVVSEVSE